MASLSAIIVWLSLMRSENRFRAAEGGTGPIALTLELKSLARVKAVVIEWQAAAKSFEVQVASDAGPWSVFASALCKPESRRKWNMLCRVGCAHCKAPLGWERRSAGPSQATL